MHRIALALSVGSVVAVLLAGAGAATPPKSPPTRLVYTVSVQFEGTESYLGKSLDGATTEKDRIETGVAGRSGRFLLVRSGTGTKPLYTLTSLDGTPKLLRIGGWLDAFRGTRRVVSLLPGRCQNTGYTETYTISKGRTAAIEILLLKNRFQVLSISASPMITMRVIWDPPCGGGTDVRRCDACLDLSPGNPNLAALSPKLGVIDGKQVRFGQPFTLSRHADAHNDPALKAARVDWECCEVWSYDWTMKFTPVKGR